MKNFVWHRLSILTFVILLVVPTGHTNEPLPTATDNQVQVFIDAPDNYISGGVFKLQAAYQADGELTYVEVDDRLLSASASFVVQLPMHKQGVLKEIKAELRHPKYKPTIEVVAPAPGLTNYTITMRPIRWTTDRRHAWIKPKYETLVAGMEHLRWIRTTYFQRPEWLAVNEAYQKDYRLVALLAYGGGGKKGEWEELRQETIAEWKTINKIMEERSFEPCPAGYVLETITNRPCGAVKSTAMFPDPVALAERAAEQKRRDEEKWPQINFAREDLARRLQMDANKIRFAAYERTMWETTAIGCPEEGKTYEEKEVLGYLILVQPPNENYFYHGEENEMPFFCAEDQRTH